MTMTVVGWGVSMGTRCVIIYQLLWRWGRFIIVIVAVFIIFYYKENSSLNQVWYEIKSTTTTAMTVLSKKEELMWKELWFIPFIQSHLILGNILSIIYGDYPRNLTCTFVDVLIRTAIFFLCRKENYRTNISLYHSVLLQYLVQHK